MRYILTGLGIMLFFSGCADKYINKAKTIQIQKQDANKAWRDLDKE